MAYSIKFYKDTTNWDNASVGSVLFDTNKHQIFLRTAANTDVGFGNIRDAVYEEVAGTESASGDGYTTKRLKIWKTGDPDNKPSIDMDFSDVASASAVQDLITKLSDAIASINKNLEDKYYTKNEIDGKLGSTFHYKGTKDNFTDLPSEGNTIGDVWNIKNEGEVDRFGTKIKAGDNVVWGSAVGDVAEGWDVLAGIASGYVSSDDFTKKLVEVTGKITNLEDFAGGTFVQTVKGEIAGTTNTLWKKGMLLSITPITKSPASGKGDVVIKIDETTLDNTLLDIYGQISAAAQAGVISLGGATGAIKVDSSVDPSTNNLGVQFSFIKADDGIWTMKGTVKIKSTGSVETPIYINKDGIPMEISKVDVDADDTGRNSSKLTTSKYVNSRLASVESTIMGNFNWQNWS